MTKQRGSDTPPVRVQALVVRELTVLLVRHTLRHWEHWCLPGGASGDDEPADEAVLRILKKECGVDGLVLRLTSNLIEASGTEAFTYLVDIGDQEPRLQSLSKHSDKVPKAVELKWLRLDEIPERDRAFLWQAGLMTVPGFLDQVENWGDDISCPSCIG